MEIRTGGATVVCDRCCRTARDDERVVYEELRLVIPVGGGLSRFFVRVATKGLTGGWSVRVAIKGLTGEWRVGVGSKGVRERRDW
jgi:hypothetical protein